MTTPRGWRDGSKDQSIGFVSRIPEFDPWYQMTPEHHWEGPWALLVWSQNKQTTPKYHCIYISKVKILKVDHIKCYHGCREIRSLKQLWWECTIVHTVILGNKIGSFLKTQNMQLPHDSAMVLLGIYPGKMKTFVHIITCTWVFIGAFIHKSAKLETQASFSG